jgi:hypothetical protein
MRCECGYLLPGSEYEHRLMFHGPWLEMTRTDREGMAMVVDADDRVSVPSKVPADAVPAGVMVIDIAPDDED